MGFDSPRTACLPFSAAVRRMNGRPDSPNAAPLYRGADRHGSPTRTYPGPAARPCPPRLAPVGRSPVRSFLPWPAPPHRLGHAVRWVLSDEALGHSAMDVEAEDEWTALRFRPIA